MILLLATSAFADQCAWNKESHAAAGLEHLPPGAEYVSFCEPCDDAAPVVARVGRSAVTNVSGDYWEVSVDGKGIDLAYTFVKASPSDAWYTNLAKLVGCPASGVSRKVTVEGAPSGQASRLKDWFGTYDGHNARVRISQYYDDPRGLLVEFEFPMEHPSMSSTVQLSSYVDIDGDPLTFKTPFKGCTVRLEKATAGVRLTPLGCGEVGAVLGGDYAR